MSDFSKLFSRDSAEDGSNAPAQKQPFLPKLPIDLKKLNIPTFQAGESGKLDLSNPGAIFENLNPETILDKATTAYCASQKPEIYAYYAAGGFGAGVIATMVLVLVLKFVASMFRRSA